MITLGDLLRIINNDEAVTVETREEETNALLEWWYGTPRLLSGIKEIKDISYAYANEIKVDSENEMAISILFDMEGEE